MPHCNVSIYNRQKEIAIEFDVSSIQAVVDSVLVQENEEAHFLSVHFLSDRLMRKYHKKFFQDGSSTDCMSFPIDIDEPKAMPRALGDIFICPKIALIRAKNNIALFWEEITLYLVHSLLHLLGYEDTSPSLHKIMHTKEKNILCTLKESNTLISGDFH